MPIFSRNGQFLIFWPKFGKLPNYVQYFGSIIVEGVAESWVEAEISWVEVDGAGWRWVHGLVITNKESLFMTHRDKTSVTSDSFVRTICSCGNILLVEIEC